MTGDYPLRNSEKKGTPNLGSLRVILTWQPDPYNEGVVGLRQPLPTYDGELIIKFPAGRTLPKGDPYVKFFLTHALDTLYSFKDKHIKNSTDPDFNYTQTVAIKSLSEQQLRTLRLTSTVMNYNFMVDTTFGGITIPISDLLRKPGTWVNEYQTLYNDDGVKMESYLYIQATYNNTSTQVPETVDFSTWVNAGRPPTIAGKVRFTYVGLRNIKNMDLTGASDPFVEVKFSRGSTSAFKTTT
jgi:hypothetical protein